MRSEWFGVIGGLSLLCGPVASAQAPATTQLPLVPAIPAVGFETVSDLLLPTDIAAGRGGRFYVVESGRNQVLVLDADGERQGTFGSTGDAEGQLQGPVGIAVDGRRVYVADRGNQRLQVFRDDGSFDGTFSPESGEDSFRPVGIAVGDGGRLFVSDAAGHRIVVFDRRRRLQRTIGGRGDGDGQFEYPGSLAAQNGRLIAADILNSRIQILDEEGSMLAEFGRVGMKPGDFVRPKGVAVAPDGRIFVSDSYLGIIQAFGPDGSLIGVLAVGGEPLRLESPTGLTMAGDRLVVVDTLGGKVAAYDVEGGA